jgi:cyclopropane fatty-acyl-phospholipid synthase-like methyltransferase
MEITMPDKNKREWFSEWFDSPYYHILYKERNELEAEQFIDILISHLKLKQESTIMDLACGKGRHSIYLNKKGFKVTGLDLSKENIKYASEFSNDRLNFYVHDMREVFSTSEFNVILNLFTSFGYFESEQENFKSIEACSLELKKGGVLVIDFMNTAKTIKNLIGTECKTIENIKFCITRKLENGFIVKDITFTTGSIQHIHQERVKAIHKNDFIKYFNFAGLTLTDTFGDYKLRPFNEEESDRMIFILQKN